MDPGDELITFGEALERLKPLVNAWALRRRADEGELGPIFWSKPPGKGHRRFKASAVEAYRQRLLGNPP